MSAPGSTTNPTTDTTTPETATPNSGRDQKGRFTKNNDGGPGNPHARQVAALKAALMRKTTEKDMEEIADVLILLSKGGDLAATKLLFTYTLGKPANATDPDRLAIEELRLFVQQSAGMDIFAPILSGFPASLALNVIRTLVPALAEEYRKVLLAKFTEDLPSQPPQAQPPSSAPAPQEAPAPAPTPASPRQPRKQQGEPAPPPPTPREKIQDLLDVSAFVLRAACSPSPSTPAAPPTAPAVSKRGETVRHAGNEGQSPPPAPPPA